MSGYTVERDSGGERILVRGNVPLTDMCALMEKWGDDGFTVVDAWISDKLGATIAVARDQDAADLWRDELNIPRATRQRVD